MGSQDSAVVANASCLAAGGGDLGSGCTATGLGSFAVGIGRGSTATANFGNNNEATVGANQTVIATGRGVHKP